MQRGSGSLNVQLHVSVSKLISHVYWRVTQIEDHIELLIFRLYSSPLNTITNTHTNCNCYKVITALCFLFISNCQCQSTCAVYSYIHNSKTSHSELPRPRSSFNDNILSVCSLKMNAYGYRHCYKAFILLLFV